MNYINEQSISRTAHPPLKTGRNLCIWKNWLMAGVTCVVSSIVTKLSLMSGHCVSLNMRDVTPVGDKEEKICCLLSFINLLQPSLEGDFKKVLFCFYYMNSNYTTNVNNFAVICLKIFLRLLYFGSIIFKNLSKLKIDVLHSYL